MDKGIKQGKDYNGKFYMYVYHGDSPKLFEYDGLNRIVDIFVYKDTRCPYPFSITNTENVWHHQGFYLRNFITYINDFFKKNDLPYEIREKWDKKK